MNFKTILSALALTIPLLTATAQEPLGEIIERGLSVSRSQSLTMARSLEKQNDINTGSEYLCCAVFCALGLPADDPF